MTVRNKLQKLVSQMHCLVICLPYKSSSLAGSWFPNNSMNTKLQSSRSSFRMEKLTNWSRKFVVLKRCLRLMPDRAAWTWCMMTRLNIVFMVIFDPRKLKNLMTLERQLTYGFQRKISYFMQFQSRKLVGCSRKSWEKLDWRKGQLLCSIIDESGSFVVFRVLRFLQQQN